jgi:hypothetical protein
LIEVQAAAFATPSHILFNPALPETLLSRASKGAGASEKNLRMHLDAKERNDRSATAQLPSRLGMWGSVVARFAWVLAELEVCVGFAKIKSR